jgi:hypothetical protein
MRLRVTARRRPCSVAVKEVMTQVGLPIRTAAPRAFSWPLGVTATTSAPMHPSGWLLPIMYVGTAARAELIAA